MTAETYRFHSSNISGAQYNSSTETLQVMFHGGSGYEYSNVPLAVWEGLKAAPSAGKFFHSYIRKRFPWKRIR
jgi:hypothetical protein